MGALDISLQRLNEAADAAYAAADALREAARIAEKMAEERGRKVTYRAIEDRACRLFGISRADIQSLRTANRVTLARQFTMYWTARRTYMSLPQIGRLMNKDHSTVISGVNRYIERRKAMGRTLRPLR